MTNVDLLNSAQACARLKISRSTLSRWVTAGRLRPVVTLPGIRGAMLFAPDSVDRLAGQDEDDAA